MSISSHITHVTTIGGFGWQQHFCACCDESDAPERELEEAEISNGYCTECGAQFDSKSIADAEDRLADNGALI